MKKVILVILIIAAIALLTAATFEEASRLYEQEKYEGAADILKPLVKANSENKQYIRMLGLSYFNLSQKPDAGMVKLMSYFKKYKKLLDKVIEMDPKDVECLEIMANSYFYPPKIAGGNKKKALKYLEMIKLLEPKKGMEIEIDFLLYEKEYDEVENICSQYILQYPEDTDMYYTLGMMYQQKKEYEKAFTAFENNLQENPEAWNTMYQYARTAVFCKTNAERGIEFLTEYTQHEPEVNSPGLDSAYWRMGLLYEILSNFDEARQAYDAGLVLNPDNKEIKKELKKYE